MYIRQLALTNFRNYVRLGLNLQQGVTVFYGDNAQGKSNLLEAAHVLATTRSLRANVDRELINWRALETGSPFARLEARVGRGGGELHVELLLQTDMAPGDVNGTGPTFGKTIKVNGLPSRAAQLVGQVNVVLFSPEDVTLASGPPAGRRRYLDLTNSQVNPSYLRALQRYNRVLVQRNQLLRQLRDRRQPPELLSPWNEEQVSLGSLVLAQRLKMISATNVLIGDRFRELSGTGESLEMVYTASSLPGPDQNGDLADLGRSFQARLDEVAARELDQAVSLIGPHRDDFAFRLDGMDVGTYGSRGQQRLVVLALKLAEAEFMQSETAERPILLLDDVLSELDTARCTLVLDQLAREGQTLLTTTNLDDLPPRFRQMAELFRVSAGAIESDDTAMYNSTTSARDV